jgi:GntR family transcriptional regulator/GntR family frlABCD operon transcriptional regulator
MNPLLYKKVQSDIKCQIFAGIYNDGDLLPSEHELCRVHEVTRATVRQALRELVSEGYIIKKQGKGSIVTKRQRRTLGVLSVKGFSEIVSETKQTVSTVMIEKPVISRWNETFFYPIGEMERKAGCVFLKRLRCVENEPVMLESTFIPNINLPRLCSKPFVKDSLFETLSVNYQIEIKDVEQDLRAVLADKETADLLNVTEGCPLLHILLKFHTNREHLFVYSSLFCNTDKYSIGNKL